MGSDAALRGRIGGFATHAKHDSAVITAPARRAFIARFEDHVDPDRKLPDAERQKRAQAALRAHMARLAHRSAQRRKRGGAA